MNNPAVDVRSVITISENLTAVNYTNEDEFVEVMGNTNVVLAAYTTAQARLRWIDASYILTPVTAWLYLIVSRFLFVNFLDSVIFVSRMDREEYQVPTGSYLGDMTNELKDYGADSYITEFASGGPKNYGYKIYSTNDGQQHTSVKVKGFSLDYVTSRRIHFKALSRKVRDFVHNQTQEPIKVVHNQIGRQADHSIVTTTTAKNYRVVYDKRAIRSDYTTLPYGY